MVTGWPFLQRDSILWLPYVRRADGHRVGACEGGGNYLARHMRMENSDHDNISVGVRDESFRAIELRVKGGAIEFSRVVVHYADGEPEEVAVRDRIPAGGTTRAIDLRGNKRLIRALKRGMGAAGWLRRPEMHLYGMR